MRDIDAKDNYYKTPRTQIGMYSKLEGKYCERKTISRGQPSGLKRNQNINRPAQQAEKQEGLV